MTRMLMMVLLVCVLIGCAAEQRTQQQAKAGPESLDFIEGVVVPPGGSIFFPAVEGAAPQSCDPLVCDKRGDDTPQTGRGGQ